MFGCTGEPSSPHIIDDETGPGESSPALLCPCIGLNALHVCQAISRRPAEVGYAKCSRPAHSAKLH